MTFCLVYEDVQKRLIDKVECPAVMNQILWNAVILVQGLWFIENGERFSPKYFGVKGSGSNGLNHTLGFTGNEVDDFISGEKRQHPLFHQIENYCHIDDANVFFPNVETLSHLMNQQYKELKKKIHQLSIERHQVAFHSKATKEKMTCSTNIFTPFYHFTKQNETMPLWCNKSVWQLF